MKKEVRVLILEDDPQDVFRLTLELRQSGIPFQSEHVYSRDAFRKALDQGPPDLILSDQGLPSFDGYTALQIAQEKCPQVPFIVVSGTYNQETAVEMLMNGASDYIYKGNLADLIPAVNQALQEVEKGTALSPEEPVEEPEEEPVVAQEAEVAELPPRIGPPIGAGLFICPMCQQLADEQGSPQKLPEYMESHDKANIVSAVCPRCAYQFH